MPYTERDPLLPKNKPSPEIREWTRNEPSHEYQYPQQPATDPSSGEEQQVPRQSPKSSAINCILVLLYICCIFLVLSSGIFEEPESDKRPIPKTVKERVNRILTDTPLIDGHNDLAILIRFAFNNHIYDDNFTIPWEQGNMLGHVDLPRLKESKSGGAFWSVFVPCPANWTDFSDESYAPSVAFTLNQIDMMARLQAAYPEIFSLPGNSSTALSVFKSGQLISPLGVEGLHQIGNSFSNLRLFHSLGVRYSTLTHNCHNRYADAALVEVPGGIEKSKPHWGGVSPAGHRLIGEMNRLGMIVDLAHTSQDTMRDVLGAGKGWIGSAAPVIYSHSSAYSLCPHPRNVPDDILQLVKDRNSLVMVNFSPDFISCIANPDNKNGVPDFYPKNSTLAHVVRHVRYIGDLIGYDHVGLGSDFDGIETTPEGLDHVGMFPQLVAEMLQQGISDEDASKIVGGNILRVWKDVDRVAEEMQAMGVKPAEDDLPGLRFGL